MIKHIEAETKLLDLDSSIIELVWLVVWHRTDKLLCALMMNKLN